jgi:hypothetical protein
MSMRQPRYSKEEFARRGDELYERQVRPQVEEGNHGKVVAIDIDTGAFEVADDVLAASNRLLARRPDAQIWCVRIGHDAVYRLRAASEAVMRARSRDWLGALGGLLALLVLYACSYLIMLQPVTFAMGGSALMEHWRWPAYRFGGRVTAAYFHPINFVDRRIRPGYWYWQEEKGSMALPD